MPQDGTVTSRNSDQETGSLGGEAEGELKFAGTAFLTLSARQGNRPEDLDIRFGGPGRAEDFPPWLERPESRARQCMANIDSFPLSTKRQPAQTLHFRASHGQNTRSSYNMIGSKGYSPRAALVVVMPMLLERHCHRSGLGSHGALQPLLGCISRHRCRW